MKLNLMMNILIYVGHSRYKYFSSQTWSKFVKFYFLKNIYALHCGTEGVIYTSCDIKLMSKDLCLPKYFCVVMISYYKNCVVLPPYKNIRLFFTLP